MTRVTVGLGESCAVAVLQDQNLAVAQMHHRAWAVHHLLYVAPHSVQVGHHSTGGKDIAGPVAHNFGNCHLVIYHIQNSESMCIISMNLEALQSLATCLFLTAIIAYELFSPLQFGSAVRWRRVRRVAWRNGVG